MKKITLLLLAMFLTGFLANAQVIFEDDFESYSVGDFVAENSTVWTTWSGTGGGADDAVVTDAQANSPSQSMIINDGGNDDMVLPLGNKTSGTYMISFYIYVASGTDEAYYNFQHFEAPGTEWAFDVWFLNDGTGHLDVNSTPTTFNYTQDSWVFCEHLINIDNDEATLWIEGTEVATWQFSMQANEPTGTNQLGGIDFWAGTETSGATAQYYVDDVVYEAVATTFFEDDFESYSVGDFIAENSDVWTTWSGTGGGADDAVVTDLQANSPTQSMLINDGGNDDMVLPLGNRTSGVYEISFYIYVESGTDEAYYNFQHFENPGTEWAFDVWFLNDGTGHLDVNSTPTTFNYTQDSWVLCEHLIDIDNDEATLWVEGTEVATWQFSMQANEPTGTNQLGGIDFWAGTETSGATAKYYVDDILFTGTSSAAPPTAAVDVTSITSTGASETFALSNEGDQELVYDIYPVYPAATKHAALPETVLPKSNQQPMNSLQAVSNPQPTNIEKDGTLTHVVSAFGGGVGFGNPVTVKAAAKFRPSDIADFVGMEMTSVIIGINDLPTGNNGTLMIWERGEYTTPGPGNLIYSEDFTVSAVGEQVMIELDSPIYLDGSDIWVGYQCEDPGDGFFPLGIDEGPRVQGVNFLSTGPGWGEMSATIDGNLFIICNLTGDGISNWMSATPNAGALAGGANEDITVSFSPTGLTPGTTYNGELIVASNDPENAYLSIPVAYTPGTATDYTVTFNVTDGSDALEGVNININSTDITTDASGVATIDLPNGTYAYTATLAGYPDASGEVVVNGADITENVEMVGVNELGANAFNIYPNPSNGAFNIKAVGVYEVTIINITGEVVYKGVHEDNTVLDLTNQASGIYFLKMKTENTTISRKVVIE